MTFSATIQLPYSLLKMSRFVETGAAGLQARTLIGRTAAHMAAEHGHAGCLSLMAELCGSA